MYKCIHTHIVLYNNAFLVFTMQHVYMHQGSAHTGWAGVAGRPQTSQTHAAIFTTTQAVFVPPLLS